MGGERDGGVDPTARLSHGVEYGDAPLAAIDCRAQVSWGGEEPTKADATPDHRVVVAWDHEVFVRVGANTGRDREPIGVPGLDRGGYLRRRRGHRLERFDTRDHLGESRSELICVAEQKPAKPTDFGGHDGVIDLRGHAGGNVEDFDGAVRVGESQEVGDAASQPAARPLLARGVLKEGSGRPQPLGRGEPGVGALSPVAGREQPVTGARIAGCLEVVGDRIRVGASVRGERLADAAMPHTATRRQDAFVERLTGEGVDEANVPAIWIGLQQMGVYCPLDDRQQRLVVETGHVSPESEWHLLPDHRGHGQWHARPLPEPGHAAIDHVPEEGREHNAVECTERPAIVCGAEQHFLLQRPEEFGREQRVALGVLLQVSNQARLVRGGKAVADRDKSAQGDCVEALQIEPEPLSFAHKCRKLYGEGVAPRQLVTAVGNKQQDRPVPQAGSKIPEELQAGGVGPVKVFEQEESRTGLGERGEKSADLSEMRRLIGHKLQPALGEGGGGRWQALVEGASIEQVEPRAVRWRIREIEAGAGKHAGTPRHRLGCQIAGQGGLANARFAAQEDEPSAPRTNGGQLLAQEELLQRSADEERRRSRIRNAGWTGDAGHARGGAVHTCPIEPTCRPRLYRAIAPAAGMLSRATPQASPRNWSPQAVTGTSSLRRDQPGGRSRLDDHALQVAWVIGQTLDTVGTDNHGVRMTEPRQSGHVKTGLDGQEHHILDDVVAALVDEWPLVSLEADTMARVVALKLRHAQVGEGGTHLSFDLT